ncbi:MAG: DinB family protein [Acetobacteraceae bacterium]|nr:DinB family protein [Acetobacteraceae bacterium]
MIGAPFAQLMAAYNAEMNRRIYGAAARLGEAERRRNRGAFWHSIQGTLSHLLWADRVWMSRLAGWERPDVPLAQSHHYIEDFAALAAERGKADAAITAWAEQLDDAALAGDLRWFSGAAGREIVMSRGRLAVHFFNHQTHHRGQTHAMLTAAGEHTGETDLFLVVPDS